MLPVNMLFRRLLRLGNGWVAIAQPKRSTGSRRKDSMFWTLRPCSLRRRFQQNQEDCTITVLALLPTATQNIVEALPVESITHELQQKKSDRSRGADTLDAVPTELSSGPPSVTDDDGRSLASFQSSSYVHASQMEASSSGIGDSKLRNPSKTKAQLWNELKINCTYTMAPKIATSTHII